MLTYKKLDLPPPPLMYIKLAKHHVEHGGILDTYDDPAKTKSSYTNRKVILNGKAYDTRRQRKWALNDAFQEWCKTNLDPGCYDGSVATNEGSDPYHGPHCDAGRNYGLLWVVDTGGPDVTTSWWKDPELPLEMPEAVYPIIWADYDQVELVDRVSMQPGSWYLINVRVFHSVENIEHTRITLQSSLRDASRLIGIS